MRLGQLSRKVNVSYTEVLEFLENELGVHVTASLNAKVEDEYVAKVISHFSVTEEEQEEVSEPLQNDSVDEKEVIVKEPEKEEEITPVKSKELPDTDSSDEIKDPSTDPSIETIKAKAEKLEGLTVIGKIDLPPPPPPEMVEVDGVMYDKAELKQQRREEKERKKQESIKRRELLKKQAELRELESVKAIKLKGDAYRENAKAEKELSFEEARIQAEKELTRRKRQEEKRRREKQRKHYEEKHLVSKENIPTKKKTKKITVQEEIIEDNKVEEPKTALARFWKWLTTY